VSNSQKLLIDLLYFFSDANLNIIFYDIADLNIYFLLINSLIYTFDHLEDLNYIIVKL
jgi:hypothetical protein